MPNLSSHRLRALLGLMPFSEALGVDLETAEPATVVGSLAWSAERCTSDGILHGGALMTLADTVGALCAYLNLPERATTSTIESKTNFFRGCALRCRTSNRRARAHREADDRGSDRLAR
jgi:1,4-dihydroxy-2-naphthoyl-CoA hydrolase